MPKVFGFSICKSLFIVMAILVVCGSAHAGNRVALVIGNSNYQHVPKLPNPTNDSSVMALKLSQLGFEVVEGVDLDFFAMRNTIQKFIRKLDGADIAVFFYAGHGLQVNGRNYMAPIDASLRKPSDLSFETLPFDLVLSEMERVVKTNILFLDACRDNPLADNLSRSMGTRSAAVGRGLAVISGGVGTLISYSTQPGNVALDGTGKHSPYTEALIRHLGTPGEDVADSLRKVRKAVLNTTNGKQVPWELSSLTDSLILNTKFEISLDKKSQPEGELKSEIVFWKSIEHATNIELFNAYLNSYPKGVFRKIAKLKILNIGDKALENEVKNFVVNFNRSVSGNDEIALKTIETVYAKTVDYYGKRFSRKKIVADKLRLMKRWPKRDYRASSQEVIARCVSKTRRCFVESIVRWSVASPARKAESNGTSKVKMEIVFDGESPLIVLENGETISRE